MTLTQLFQKLTPQQVKTISENTTLNFDLKSGTLVSNTNGLLPIARQWELDKVVTTEDLFLFQAIIIVLIPYLFDTKSVGPIMSQCLKVFYSSKTRKEKIGEVLKILEN